ncbi:GSCOCT00014094001.2-RA-CDS [Cotesia congregata]|uniref:Cc_odve66_17 n=1 Tax=Cotesia congregata TaxID=51543 RepID=A0A8J2H7K9_COTCN|nr:GSCOCT00014094001.2-RA-CDS [Cotesia congregata]CAG5078890.1 Cc_odve66_17 [Cotesia congregata]
MDIVSFIVLIVILAGIWFAYTRFKKKKNVTIKELSVQERIEKLRTAIKDPKVVLSSGQQNKIKTYKDLAVDIEKEYKGWDTNLAKMKDMCFDGCKFLDFHLAKVEPVGLKIADAMVIKLLGKLDSVKGEVIKVSIWEKDWYYTSINLTYFLALYVYIGTNNDLIEGCKKQILRILPSVGVGLTKPLMGLTLFKATVSRLCVTYLMPDKFKKDITSAKFTQVKEFMNLTHVEDDTVQDGYYDDGSMILNGFASYDRLESRLGFYEKAYRSMGLQSNIKDLAVTIFPKLTHPKVRWSPPGLFRNNNDRIARWWPSSDTEINLIPFIGLGVFKCPEFMFFVRVQRPGIHPNYPAIPELAAGCIQIRRIFLKDNNTYPKNLLNTNLKDEPGVLSKVGGSVCELKDKTGGNFYCSNVSSFIGCIDDLMFWKNSYKFIELFGDVTVTEAGVISATGFQACYKIDNNSNESFKFRYKDTRMKKCYTNPTGSTEFFDVPQKDRGGSKKTKFTWTMAEKWIDYKVALTADGMEFETSTSKKYKVKKITGDNEPYVVTCGSTTLLGSSSSRIPSEITHETIKYKRNAKTMMYEK